MEEGSFSRRPVGRARSAYKLRSSLNATGKKKKPTCMGAAYTQLKTAHLIRAEVCQGSLHFLKWPASCLTEMKTRQSEKQTMQTLFISAMLKL